MIFTCHRDMQKIDFLTVHLPEKADPKSFKHDEWVSGLRLGHNQPTVPPRRKNLENKMTGLFLQ